MILEFMRSVQGLLLKAVDISAVFQSMDNEAAGGISSMTFTKAYTQGFRGNYVVFKAISDIARCASSIPVGVYKLDSEGEKQEMGADHPLSKLLRRPHPEFSYQRFVSKLIFHLYLAGKAYVHVAQVTGAARRGEKEVLATILTILRPDCVELKNDMKPEEGWSYTPQKNGDVKTIPYRDLHPIFLPDPADDFDGVSPLEPGAVLIDQGNTARGWNRNLLRNDARPSGILKSKNFIPRDKAEEVVNSFMEKWGGWKNAGRPPFATGDIEWEQMGMSPAEMEWLQGLRITDRCLATVQGMPPQLMGDPDAATYANYQEARLALYMETILPLLNLVLEEFNNWLTPSFGEGLLILPERDKIEALQESRLEAYQRMAASDWATVNEKREATGYAEWTDARKSAGEMVVMSSGIIILEDGEILMPAGLVSLKDIQAGKTLPQPGEPPGEVDGTETEEDEDEAEAEVEEVGTEEKGLSMGLNIFSVRTDAQEKAAARQMAAERAPIVRAVKTCIADALEECSSGIGQLRSLSGLSKGAIAEKLARGAFVRGGMIAADYFFKRMMLAPRGGPTRMTPEGVKLLAGKVKNAMQRDLEAMGSFYAMDLFSAIEAAAAQDGVSGKDAKAWFQEKAKEIHSLHNLAERIVISVGNEVGYMIAVNESGGITKKRRVALLCEKHQGHRSDPAIPLEALTRAGAPADMVSGGFGDNAPQSFRQTPLCRCFDVYRTVNS